MQAAPSDDMFAGLTTNSSLTPPIGRLTTPTSTTPTTGGVNSTSGPRSLIISYHSPADHKLSDSAHVTPFRITSSTISTSPANTSCCCCTDTHHQQYWEEEEEGPAGHQLQQEEEEWVGHHLYCSQLQLAPPPTPLITCSLPVSSNQPSHHGAGQLVSTRSGQSTGAMPSTRASTTALEPHPQGSILQPTPSQLSSSNSSTMGWSSGCQLSTAAGTSPLLVPTAHQTAFPRQEGVVRNTIHNIT